MSWRIRADRLPHAPETPSAADAPVPAPLRDRPNKRIAIFCDGTWNALTARSRPTSSSARRWSALCRPRRPPAARLLPAGRRHLLPRQQARGSLARNAFGLGLFENIVEAYRFLVFNYRTGDEIYLFGFSRGAFTARSLAGLIRKCGIVTPDRIDKFDEALELYRLRGDEGHPDNDRAQRFRAENAPEMIMKDRDRVWRAANGYKELYEDLPNFKIRYLGVWDTVGARGIPRHLLVEMIFRTADKYRFHDLRLSSSIWSARHAVAIDEDRLSYAPTLWLKESDIDNESASRHVERWFPGDHSSVGGGGDIRGLSHDALLWVMEGAHEAGLDLDEALMENIARGADYTAPLRAFTKKPGPFSFVHSRGPRTGPDDESYLAASTVNRLAHEAKSAGWTRYRPAALLPLLRRLFPDEGL